MAELNWVDDLKVVDLRKRLKDLGVNSTGKKAVLVERLKSVLAQQQEEKQETNEPEGDVMEIEDVEDRDQKNEATEDEKKTAKGGLNELLGDGKDDLEFDYETEKPNRKKQKVTETPKPVEKSEAPVTQKEPEKKNTEDDLVDFETTHAETKPIEVQPKTTEIQRAPSAAEVMEIEAPVVAEEDRTCALRIQNFVRPFTEKAAKEMLSTYGTVVDMWMPPIKTHCFVIYETESEAHEAYLGTYHVVWPRGGKHLLSQFVLVDEAKKAIEDGRSKAAYARPSGSASFQKTRPTLYPPNNRSPPVHAPQHGTLNRSVPALSLEDLFCKTQTKPPIYYLPLTDEQVAERKLQAQEKATQDEKSSEDPGRKTA